jgi:succinate dehydrogenase / fumarate reductase cytochrome b subunit
MPVAAVVSILHRISGVFWLLALPLLLYAFEHSLQSEQSYRELLQWINHPAVAALLLLWLWLLLHHFFAGIRFVLLDMDIAISRIAARRAAWLVHLASIGSLLIIVGMFL